MSWYPTDGSSELVGRAHAHGDAWDVTMGELLSQWLAAKDLEHRQPMGAIVLAQFADGFDVHYLGPEHLDAAELVRRVVWIGDAMREASGG